VQPCIIFCKWSQLGAHYFSVYLFQLLYMFLATMCPSPGEITVFMRYWYFSLCMGGCLMCWSGWSVWVAVWSTGWDDLCGWLCVLLVGMICVGGCLVSWSGWYVWVAVWSTGWDGGCLVYWLGWYVWVAVWSTGWDDLCGWLCGLLVGMICVGGCVACWLGWYVWVAVWSPGRDDLCGWLSGLLVGMICMGGCVACWLGWSVRLAVWSAGWNECHPNQQTRQRPTQSEKYQCRIDTVSSPDDETIFARNT